MGEEEGLAGRGREVEAVVLHLPLESDLRMVQSLFTLYTHLRIVTLKYHGEGNEILVLNVKYCYLH